MTTTANRRRLPDNCRMGSRDISVLAMMRSSQPQWDSVLRVAKRASEVVELAAPDSEKKIRFRVTLNDGQTQTGTVDVDGGIERGPAIAADA